MFSKVVNREVRQEELCQRISALILKHSPNAELGLDLGTQYGLLAGRLFGLTGIRMVGIDRRPDVHGPLALQIVKGQVAVLPFRDRSFDLVTAISLFEHIPPDGLGRVLLEIARVLRPGGCIVGEIPNPNYPIEPHSRLPLIQFLPDRLAVAYYNHLSPFRTAHPLPIRKGGRQALTWYNLHPDRLREASRRAGFGSFRQYAIDYSPNIFPERVRWLYPLLSALPMTYDFVVKDWSVPGS